MGNLKKELRAFTDCLDKEKLADVDYFEVDKYLSFKLSESKKDIKSTKQQLPQADVIKSVCDRCEGKPESADNVLCSDCYSDLHGM